jgi:hypothetical protein
MQVFHGSNVRIEKIDLAKSEFLRIWALLQTTGWLLKFDCMSKEKFPWKS